MGPARAPEKESLNLGSILQVGTAPLLGPLGVVVAVAAAVTEVFKFLQTPIGIKVIERSMENGDKFEANMRRLFPKLFQVGQ
jgi:hypothetical protein